MHLLRNSVQSRQMACPSVPTLGNALLIFSQGANLLHGWSEHGGADRAWLFASKASAGDRGGLRDLELSVCAIEFRFGDGARVEQTLSAIVIHLRLCERGLRRRELRHGLVDLIRGRRRADSRRDE